MMVRVADNNTRPARPLAGRRDFEEAPDADEELLLVLGFAFSGRFVIEFLADDSQFHLTVGHDDRHVFGQIISIGDDVLQTLFVVAVAIDLRLRQRAC